MIFDLESDGLLPEMTRIHSLVLKDMDTGQVWSYCDQPGHPSIHSGLRMLEEASVVCGHNIMGFDLRAIQKVDPNFRLKEGCVIRDTLLISRLIWTDLDDRDHARIKRGTAFPARLIGRHSLEAWGYRLGVLKGDFGKSASWEKWTPEMQRYCEQDVVVTDRLLRHISKENYSEEAITLEHDFADVIYRMMDRGFSFDETQARSLYATLLTRRAELYDEIQVAFPPQIVEYVTPKKKQKKTKTVRFNPGSRKQVAERLQALGWVPEKHTESGMAQVDDAVLEEMAMRFPQAKPLAEYFMVEKRIGQMAEGKQAWLKLVRAGRIHCEVNTNRAVTGRCGHSSPNVAQVPRVGSPYGAECRGLFRPSSGMVLVGADASGLELRCLAHFLGLFDGGAYAKVVCEGDVHTANQAAFGLPPGKEHRGLAKNGIYCLIYGGGDWKLGITVFPPDKFGGKTDDEYAAIGKRTRSRFGRQITGYSSLVDLVKGRASQRGWVKGLDGRRLHVRSQHAALNTLLQSAGALLVKKATVLWYRACLAAGLKWGEDFALVAHIHDEIQAEARPEHADLVGRLFVESIRQAGEQWKFRCPLSGEFKVGESWAATH